ncbi:MAG TPA: hypothetical protein VE983_13725 [Solirubrobacteraceae bacterium]|nr:hypothetical protein [Solirubrobacteraceae bacterium]
MRFPFEWQEVAPKTRPSGFVASNPGSQGYNWSWLDSAVEDIAAHGLQPVLLPYLAPLWAQDGTTPAGVRPGSWKPDPTQFGDFGKALATRYSGHYKDPSTGKTLPHVTYYQAWNEPNLSFDISPAWEKRGSSWVPESPNIYRPMLNAFYSAVKSVDSSDFVLAGGTAPYGDSRPVGSDPKKWRVRPLAFDRGLLCLTRGLKKVAGCGPVHFDALDNHPYAFGPPTQKPYHPDDVNIADTYKISRVLRAGLRAGTVLPAGSKQIWAGELSFATDPPLHTKLGVPPARQARYIEESMYLLWRQHVSTVLLLDIRDMAPSKSHNPFFYGGLYFYSGAAKPSVTAFSFPFITRRLGGTHIQAWGRAPTGGTLRIERQAGGKWEVVTSFAVSRHQVFQTSVKDSHAASFRAQIGSDTSLIWTQG